MCRLSHTQTLIDQKGILQHMTVNKPATTTASHWTWLPAGWSVNVLPDISVYSWSIIYDSPRSSFSKGYYIQHFHFLRKPRCSLSLIFCFYPRWVTSTVQWNICWLQKGAWPHSWAPAALPVYLLVLPSHWFFPEAQVQAYFVEED